MKKICLLALLFQGTLYAQNAPVNANRIPIGAFPFLNLTYDARSAAIGEAGVATTPDQHSAYLNPAKLVFLPKKDSINHDVSALSLAFTKYAKPLIPGMFLGGFSAFTTNEKNQAFALNVKYFHAGMTELRDLQGKFIKDIRSQEFAIEGFHARPMNQKNSLGLGLRYVHSNLAGQGVPSNGIASKKVHAFSGDIFYFHNGRENREKKWLNYGAALTSIGPKVRYFDYKERTFQPTRLKVGIAQNFILGSTQKEKETRLMLTVDANKLLVPTPPLRAIDNSILAGKDEATISGIGSIFQSWTTAPDGIKETFQEVYYNVGAELAIKEMLALRVGYYAQHKNKGNLHYLTVGAGLHLGDFSLDAALLFPDKASKLLAQTFRLQLTYFPTKN